MWTHRPSRGPSDPHPSWALLAGSMGGGIVVSGRARAWTRRRSSRWFHRDRRLHRNRPLRANRHPSRPSIVLGRLDCDGVSGLRCRWECPAWSPNGQRSHRSREPFLPRGLMRPATVGRRWLSRHCRPRRDRLGSSGELLSLGARERDSERTWGRTWGVVPTCGAAAVLVVRARPQSVGTAAHWVARVIAHPIRPSPALAFPRSRLSGVPGPGGRRFARLLDDVDLARAPHGKLRSASRSVVSITAGSPRAGREAKSGADIARLLRTLSSIWGSP
jgi:hypothetical protein